LIFKVFAFLKLGIEEIHNPNLLSAVELEDLLQIKLNYFRPCKQVGYHLLLLLLLLMESASKVEMMSTATTMTLLKEVGKDIVEALVVELLPTLLTLTLFVLTNAF